MKGQIRNLTNVRHHHLVAIRDVGTNGKARLWLARCDCGNEIVVSSKVFGSTTKSCGCQRIAAAKVVLKTHGLYRHRLYWVWCSMRNRCRDPKNKHYANYGGRGIMVDPEWNDFAKFISDMWPTYQEGLSIDRINNDDGYNFGNCRWATRKQQQNNMRTNVAR